MKSLLGIAIALLLVGCARSEGAPAATSGSDPAATTAAAPATAPAAVAAETAVSEPAPVSTAPAMAAEKGGSCCGGGAGGGTCGGGAGCGGMCGGAMAAPTPPTDGPANAAWSSLKVSGMRCGGCAKRIMAAVGKLDGVVAVQADHGTGQVLWAVHKGDRDRRDLVAGEIQKLGYQPQL